MTDIPEDNQDKAIGRTVVYVGGFSVVNELSGDIAAAHWRIVLEADQTVNLELNIGTPTHNPAQPFHFQHEATRYKLDGVPAGLITGGVIRKILADQFDVQLTLLPDQPGVDTSMLRDVPTTGA